VAVDPEGRLLMAPFLDAIIEVAMRIAGKPGSTLLPRRSIIERNFGWIRRFLRFHTS
jgi:hypothetical protein